MTPQVAWAALVLLALFAALVDDLPRPRPRPRPRIIFVRRPKPHPA